MPRAIVHLDADAFYASVEQASDPRLRGKPVAVGGERRGIVASASYEARRFGVYTPMPTVRARQLCPKLIVVPGDFEKYELFSRWMFSYVYDFTPDVEIGSIDEGYFDLTACRKTPLDVAATIRRAIRQSLKITVSEGIGSNKLVSQIASKLNKPASFFEVPSGRETLFLHPLPNRWLPGIGPKTAQRLNAAGLARIAQIAATPTELLHLLVGSVAPRLREFSRGIDERPVVPASEPAKSYGQQETFSKDQTDIEFLAAILRKMADQLMAKVREDHKTIRTLTVKVRYNDMAEDQAGESLPEPTNLETDLYSRTRVLLQRAWKRRVSLRLVSLRLSNVYAASTPMLLPIDAAARQQSARQRLAATLDRIREIHGARAICRGHDFVLKQQPHDATQPAAAPPGSIQPLGASVLGDTPFSPTPPAPDKFEEKELTYGRVLARRQRLANNITLAPAVSNDRPNISTREPLSGGSAPVQLHRRHKTVRHFPLEVHSYYSFLDSTLSVEAIVQHAQQQRWPAAVLTDTGNLHGIIPFVQCAVAAGIKPIVGAAVTVGATQLLLYVEQPAGYTQLCRILSSTTPAVGQEPNVGTPRVTPAGKAHCSKAALEHGTSGLIAISSNPHLADLFPGRFYLAVGDPRQLSQLSASNAHRMVGLFPVHYARPEDRWRYDIVQSIRTLTLLNHAHPDKQSGGAFHYQTPEELRVQIPDASRLLHRAEEIIERCVFHPCPAAPQFPQFIPATGQTARAFLRDLVFSGARRRYGTACHTITSQLDLELSIIGEVGYDEYFLVMWDILQECRRRDIEWITRGSAADSLVCYCLDISDVCPIRFELYFRRFLNRERMALNKLPDIDVDFAHDRKDDVLDLIFSKYGHTHTAAVGGFSTYQARSALADVAKVLGVSEHQIRRITERLPHFSAAHELDQATKSSRECADLPLQEEPYRSALQMAQFLDGFPRYPKMHPCGVVMSRQPMLEVVPTFTSSKGYPTTHFDMDAIEIVGLIKMDILAQGGLAVMRDVKQRLAKQGNPGPAHTLPRAAARHATGTPSPPTPGSSGNTNAEIDLHGLAPWTDPAVWEMIANGGARAVHHIESPAMVSLCGMCNVRDIDTLIAIVSVIRPGAANENRKVEFARRYQGMTETVYPHPSLAACLKSTFGMVVYEEHILQICEAFAGLPPGRADVLRRALAKDKTAVITEIAGEFARSARQLGRFDEDILRVWGLVAGFRGYAFCKAHSTAYGVEAYEAAWLKRYYPAEFMAAVLTNGKGFYHPLVYVLECHRLGIGFLPPNVNDPGPSFTPRLSGNGRPLIRVPVTYIKGLGRVTQERIIAEHRLAPFLSCEDFYRRVRPQPDDAELLLKAGAFDVFGKPLTAQFWECQLLQRSHGTSGKPGQGWLFPPPGLERLPSEILEEPSRRQRLEWEAELFEFPASGHPLELHDHIAWDTYCAIENLHRHIGEQVVTCGLVIEQRLHHQETGETMKFLTLADRTGIVETELFAPTYRSYGLATVRYPVLEVTATVEPYENGRGFSLRVHRAGKPRTK